MMNIAGEYQLPLNTIDLAGPVEEWKDLAPVDDGSNQYLGDLCVSLRYVPSSGKLTGNQRLIMDMDWYGNIMKHWLLVAVLEARKLKKMDITGASDPYVKLKLFDSKVFDKIQDFFRNNNKGFLWIKQYIITLCHNPDSGFYLKWLDHIH